MDQKSEKIISVFLTNYYEQCEPEDIVDKIEFITDVKNLMQQNDYKFTYDDILYIWHKLIEQYLEILDGSRSGVGWSFYKFMKKNYDSNSPVFTIFNSEMTHIILDCVERYALKFNDDLTAGCIDNIQANLPHPISDSLLQEKWKKLKEEYTQRISSDYLEKLDKIFNVQEASEQENITQPDILKEISNNNELQTTEVKQLLINLLEEQKKTNIILMQILQQGKS